MKSLKILIIYLVFGMLISLLGCRSGAQKSLEEKPFGDVDRTYPSINQEPPEVVAQKMFETDKNEVAKIGPQVLRSWREKSGILILDLMSDQTRSKFGKLEESQVWDGNKVFKVAKTTAIVLVGSHQKQALVEKSYRKLVAQGYQNLFVLDGGIEAWAKIYGKR
jgi:rhodanese-related sulfurtransferase